MSQSTKVGVVGAGGIAGRHLPAWLALGARVFVFSTDRNGPALVAEAGGGVVVDSLEQLLQQSEVVDICTPTYTHREIAETAARAGCHVICEKPLALSQSDALAMADECERNGVRLFPAHVVRFFPEYFPMHQSIDQGRIGKVCTQRFTRIGESPTKEWFHQPLLSGGIIMDQMIHDIDFARWNAGDVVEVFARSCRDEKVESAQLLLKHEGGAISTINGAWAVRGATFTTRYWIAGDCGFIQHDSSAPDPVSFDIPSRGAAKGGLLPQTDFNESPFISELRDFENAIMTNSEARVAPADAIKAIAIAEAANSSAELGVPISLATGERAFAVQEHS